ncbi:DUF5378 family protein [Mycoplasmopsis glycophila]|nr:DUF5378 family protein [Mycoplasmopsis glycophila]
MLIINKKFKKYLDKYWVRVTAGLVFLTYIVLFRFVGNWSEIANITAHKMPGWWHETFHDYRSYVLSRSLFLDLCPFFTFALLLTMIFDRSKYSSFIVSPFCLFASAIVIPFVPATEKNFVFSLKYLLIATKEFRLYFFMHWFMFNFGCLAFVNYSLENVSYKRIFRDIQITLLVFASYIIIISYIFNIDKNTTGLSRKDWEKGGSFYAISKGLRVPHPYQAVLFYIFSIAWINFIPLVKYDLQNEIIIGKFIQKIKSKMQQWKRSLAK